MVTLQRDSVLGENSGFAARHGSHVLKQTDVNVVADELDRAVAEDKVRPGGVRTIERPLTRLVTVEARCAPTAIRVGGAGPVVLAEQPALGSDRRLVVRGVRVRPEGGSAGTRRGGVLADHQRVRQAVRASGKLLRS